MMFPKQEKQKKRKKHKDSILHCKDGTCYLCGRLYGNFRRYQYTEEHHIFDGNPNRRISEAEGFKVYLCPEHHRTGREAVHTNHELMQLLQRDAQKEYEKDHTREEFVALIGKNFL